MKWFLIAKNPTPSQQAEYGGWKEELRQEGRKQCCYCSIHESAFGGHRNYAVEHYRPKSLFAQLELHYPNLFYVCSVCNSFKGDDWPTDTPRPDVVGYLDPSAHDYSNHIAVDPRTGLAQGRDVAGRYKVHRLHLNRAQLILYRRIHQLLARAHKFDCFAADNHAELDKARIGRVLAVILRIKKAQVRLLEAAPYEDDDLRQR